MIDDDPEQRPLNVPPVHLATSMQCPASAAPYAVVHAAPPVVSGAAGTNEPPATGAGEGADGASGDGNANGNGGAANEFEMNPVHEQGYEEVELSVPPTIRAIEEEPRGGAGEARDDSIWSGSRLASG